MTQTTYTAELAAKFCEAVAAGQKSIRSICKQTGMPSKATVFRWLAERPEFQKMYEIAKDEAIDTIVEETVEIADNCKNDADSIRKARLRIDARVEAAQLLRPKKYGRQVQLTGAGGGPIEHKMVTAMTDDELLAIATRKDGDVPES